MSLLRPSGDPTKPPLRYLLGFLGLAASATLLGFYATAAGHQHLAEGAFALTATGVLGGGRLIARALTAAFIGPRFVALADIPLFMFALILIMNAWAFYGGPAWVAPLSGWTARALGWLIPLLGLALFGGFFWQLRRWRRSRFPHARR